MKICRQYFPENAFKAASAACRLLAMALCMLAAASLSLSARTSAGTDSLAVATVLADRTVPTHIYDGSLVMGNLMNAACALGVGSCWIHRAKEIFDSAEGKALLESWGIKGDYEGIGFCILGFAKDGYTPAAKPRKEDYVRYI